MEEMGKKISITVSEEWKQYIAALSECASDYVPRIRQQFAAKAYDNFQNETIRKLVLAYGEEVKKLRESRERDFKFYAENPEMLKDNYLSDSCLSNEKSYRETLMFLFDIV